MGYSDSNFQIGQALHKEYEQTYSATHYSTSSNATKLNVSDSLIRLVTTVVVMAGFVGLVLSL